MIHIIFPVFQSYFSRSEKTALFIYALAAQMKISDY